MNYRSISPTVATILLVIILVSLSASFYILLKSNILENIFKETQKHVQTFDISYQIADLGYNPQEKLYIFGIANTGKIPINTTKLIVSIDMKQVNNYYCEKETIDPGETIKCYIPVHDAILEIRKSSMTVNYYGIEQIKLLSYRLILDLERVENISTPIEDRNWLFGWSYRVPITITERSRQNLIDYQVNIAFDSASLISQGKMRSDCGDIRFTDSDGVTLLPYWIESCPATKWTNISVQAFYEIGTECISDMNNFPSTPNSYGTNDWWTFDPWEDCDYCDMYVRIYLNITGFINSVLLEINSDDGHVVWINGQTIGSAGGYSEIYYSKIDEENLIYSEELFKKNIIFDFKDNYKIKKLYFSESSSSEICHRIGPAQRTWDITNYVRQGQNEIRIWCSEWMYPEFCYFRLFINGQEIRFNGNYSQENLARIWVRVNLTANQNKTIYMYYGNPSATSLSNGDAVFEFFDDFSTDPNTNRKWIVFRNLNNPEYEFFWDSQNKQVYLTKREGGTVIAFINKTFSPYNKIIEFEFYISGECNGWGYCESADGLVFYFDKDISPYLIYRKSEGGGGLAARAEDDSMQTYLSVGYGVGFDSFPNIEEAFERGLWYQHIEITKTDYNCPVIYFGCAHLNATLYTFTLSKFWKAKIIIKEDEVELYLDRSLVLRYKGLVPLGYNWQAFAAATGGLTADHVIRNVRIRKYVYPEPLVTFHG